MQELIEQEYFKKAFDDLINWEGEQYTKDPDDPGGETKFGISKKAFPNLDIKNLTKDEAEKIYYDGYWKAAKCQTIIKMSQSPVLGQKVFNTAVNMGSTTAIKLLQRAMWSAFKPSDKCKIKEDIFTYIKTDGILGPISQKMLEVIDPDVLLATFKAEIANYYRKLIENNSRLTKYQFGWFRRAYA